MLLSIHESRSQAPGKIGFGCGGLEMKLEEHVVRQNKMEEPQQQVVEQSVNRKKKKHVSKKSKRSWRKHTDIKDIEEHLEDVRRQERLGGILSVKEDNQLFFVDKDNTDTKKDTENGKVKLPKTSRRNSSKVYKEVSITPIVGRKRKAEKYFEKGNEDEYSSEEEEKPKIIKQNKELKMKSYDLWDAQVPIDTKSDETVGTQHYLKATKKICYKQPKTAYQVKSIVPAITVCHPGASYNPTLEDHQSLLTTACCVEIVKEKEIQKIERRLQLPPAEELAKLPSWEEEMSQGLFDGEDDADEEESSSEKEDLELLPCSKIRPRKLNKEKRKENERKKEKQNTQALRKEKLKENEVFRIKNLKKQIRLVDEKTKERLRKKEEKETEASLKPKRLGKHKFEEMNIEIQLTDELSGSLRNLKPEGNLFVDRYKTLQRRNIIEPRKIVVPHRKYGLKEYEKRSFKNYDLQEKIKEKKKSRL